MEAVITLPVSWQEMSGRQLAYVLRLMAAGTPPDDIKALFTLRTIPEALRPYVRHADVAAATRYLDFIGTPPDTPVRPPRLSGGTALEKEMHGVPFSEWLIIENLWQGYLDTASATAPPAQAATVASPALTALLSHLWPGYKSGSGGTAETWHALAAVVWLQGLKTLLSRTFPHLYKAAGESADGTQAGMREVMETQIRALTMGDITKRGAVLESDTWAALAELDAKAREAAELEAARR